MTHLMNSVLLRASYISYIAFAIDPYRLCLGAQGDPKRPNGIPREPKRGQRHPKKSLLGAQGVTRTKIIVTSPNKLTGL